MIDDPIRRAWYDFCRRNLEKDIVVTFAEELTGKDAPRPIGTYITLKIISGPATLGKDELRKNSKGTFSVCGPRQYTISIQGFRSGSRQALEKLQICLQNPIEFNNLKESEADIAIVERGSVTDISALLDAGFERRFLMDVAFYSALEIETDIGNIEKVRVCGEGKEGADGTVTIPVFDVEKP